MYEYPEFMDADTAVGSLKQLVTRLCILLPAEEIKVVPDAESATPGKSGQPVSLDLTSSPGPSPGRKRKAPATNVRTT